MSQPSVAGLLWTRRMGPLYATQFLNAFNDNLFKNALVLDIAFRGESVFGLEAAQVVALAGGVFILPYFLFSALAGQLADRVDKAALMRWVKVAEVPIMGTALVGFAAGLPELNFVVLFAMGTHSAVFGPAKYSVLPQLLEERELVAGNALVEQGTYLAILLGTLAGGILVAQPGGGVLVGAVAVGASLLGVASSRFIPAAPPAGAVPRGAWEPIGPTVQVLRLARRVRSVWLSILGISWFWLFGATFLALFPPYTLDILSGDQTLATLFLALFSVGIGIGSLVCERLSRHRIELGLVPVGALGLSVFTFDLFLVGTPWQPSAGPLGVLDLLARPMGLRIAVDLLLLSVAGGLMIVPLYTMMQWRTEPAARSQVVAANNVVNALFMAVGAVTLAVALGAGATPPQVFLALSIGNALVAVYMYTVIPEFVLRFLAFVLSNVVYRVRVIGAENVPVDGACVLVCNHVSYVDWLLLAGGVPRPPRFVMDRRIYHMGAFHWLFRQARAIPVVSRKEDAALVDRAMDLVSEELRNGGVVGIFPEGALTLNGDTARFRKGIEEIVARDPVPVVPMALVGLWGSYFSRKDGAALRRPFRRFWSRVVLVIGPPVAPAALTADGLHASVLRLYAEGERR